MKKIAAFAILLTSMTYAQLKPIAYSDGKQKLNGYFVTASKKSSSNAGVLILPAWRGIDDHSKNSAQKLSELGYHAFVADIYGEGSYPKDTKEAGEKAGYYKKNFTEYHKRIQLALDQLVKSGANRENIAIIGYCFGGTGALEAARSNMHVKGVVSFHGGLGKDPARPTVKIGPKILVCHGADDFFVPHEEILAFQQEMKDTQADWQMIYYADAVHSFTEPAAGNDKTKGTAYNEKAAKRSWEHMKLFLAETLK